MALDIAPGEAYVIRRKVFKLFGAAFHIYAPDGSLVGFCRQKAFKLREDLRIYTDESCSTELVVIKARSIIDFSATYDITLGSSQSLGSLRRKGLASAFIRDHWLVFDTEGREIGELTEDGSTLAFLRRFVDLVAFFSPQRFTLRRKSGEDLAHYRQHFSPFVRKLSVSVLRDDPEIDDLVILAAGCLLAAIEGRQNSSG
ncbi:MAG: hypothetical protein AB7K52_10040 [Phycisphaerales bacterium]